MKPNLGSLHQSPDGPCAGDYVTRHNLFSAPKARGSESSLPVTCQGASLTTSPRAAYLPPLLGCDLWTQQWLVLKEKVYRNNILQLSQSLGWNEWGFPGGSVVKNPPANSGDMGSTHGSGRPPGEGNGNPLQDSCLGNPIDRGTWWAMGLQRVRHN